jgi:putative membrane protein
MGMIVKLLVNSLAVVITAYILKDGVQVKDFYTALLVALVLALVNMFIKPIIQVLTLPLSILTLGLFTFVINALMILLVSRIVPGFTVSGFWWALLFSLVLSIINSALQTFIK